MKSRRELIYIVLLTTVLISCIDEKEYEKPVKIFETSTVLDAEGISYKTIKIGNQWWMKEDLRSTKFGSGKEIKKITDAESWKNSVLPSYMIGSSGLLYNFEVVKVSKDMVPVGWHVASDEDFKRLEMELGMPTEEANRNFWRGNNIGSKLKEDYQKGAWNYFKDIWGDNESAFTALPGGCILSDGRFCEPNNLSQGFWWTSTISNNDAWFRSLDYKSNEVFRYVANRNYGMAIRCVKD